MPKKSVKKVKAPKMKSPEKDDEPLVAQTGHDDEDYDLTKEEYEDKIEKKEADEDIYTEEGREELIEDDEIDDVEEGFSKGAAPDRKKHK